ncbi:RAC-beta serine/threonine-protein kinase A [Phytophthora nicotianae]|uniref:RAC-beta serine/threonine-protein kinase A n=1 Tax=Phytophthora nicotianae TaxID=4792 RepID=A0A0W8DEB3_PHYNI|nr:RAC-beta serine/threonine-protein kinase A [Phytophthora nicotianae]
MSTTHSKPAEGLVATMDDITGEDGNYCEFQTSPSGLWHPALFCVDVVEQLLSTQFHTYMKKVQEADCKAELRRLVAKGPPIWLEDKHALPVPEGDTHITKVWFAKDDEERSAKLDGAVEGEAREALWKELRQLMDAMEEDKEEVR